MKGLVTFTCFLEPDDEQVAFGVGGGGISGKKVFIFACSEQEMDFSLFFSQLRFVSFSSPFSIYGRGKRLTGFF